MAQPLTGRGSALLSAALIAAALLLAARVPAAAAACVTADAAASNFQVTFLPAESHMNKACFRLSAERNCSTTERCCSGKSTVLERVELALAFADKVVAACTNKQVSKRKRIKVALDGVARKSSPVPARGMLNLKLPVAAVKPGGSTVCIDTTASECTIMNLCGGTECSLKLTTRSSSKCCVNGGFTLSGRATNTSGFNIKLVNVGRNYALDPYLAEAALLWEDVITIDLPDVPGGLADLSNGLTGRRSPWLYPTDDLVIFYKVAKIDGRGKTLGYAGPLYAREDGTALPVSGQMMFDSADVKNMSESAKKQIAKREIGHVLGIGTIWEERGCIKDCKPKSPAGTMNYYLCANARREYAATAGCQGDLPIQTEGDSRVACLHWREATLGDELMTPYGSGNKEPLSRITIGAIEDLYGKGSVNYAMAEPYSCPTPASIAKGAKGADSAGPALAAQERPTIVLNGIKGYVPVPGRPVLRPQHTSVDQMKPDTTG